MPHAGGKGGTGQTSRTPATAPSHCKPKQSELVMESTYGALMCFDACGYMAPGIEMVGPESRTQLITYLTELFTGRSFKVKGAYITVGYDNACGLKRTLQARRIALLRDVPEPTEGASSPLWELVTGLVDLVVDKFHYRGHVSDWCKENTNPHSSPVARAMNSSVAEQRFNWLGGYAGLLRRMRREPFNFMMSRLCDLDHGRGELKGCMMAVQYDPEAFSDAKKHLEQCGAKDVLPGQFDMEMTAEKQDRKQLRQQKGKEAGELVEAVRGTKCPATTATNNKDRRRAPSTKDRPAAEVVLRCAQNQHETLAQVPQSVLVEFMKQRSQHVAKSWSKAKVVQAVSAYLLRSGDCKHVYTSRGQRMPPT